MQEQVWYVYQNDQQIGPFALEQVQQMYSTKMLSVEAYIYKAGWKDWRGVEECYEEIGVPRPAGMQQTTSFKRTGAPRASIAGRVIVHNNGQLVIGSGVNISMTGIFVETTDQIFTVGERLKLTVKCDGLAKPFNVAAQVIRYNSDPRMAIGYGLMFESLDPLIREEIKELVATQNKGGSIKSTDHDQAQ
jgi:hypothetical protein